MRALSLLCLLGLVACAADTGGPSPSLVSATADTLVTTVNPEVPTILRDVAIFRNRARVAPAIGPFNTTNDGRLSLGAGSELAVVVPEALTTPFLDAPPGTPVRGPAFPLPSTLQLDGETVPVERGFRTICDANKGPRACGADDCYDVTIVTSAAVNAGTAQRSLRMWGAPVTIRVENPKTAAARIKSVVARGAPVAGRPHNIDKLFEPAFTSDGHLFVGRIGRQLRDDQMYTSGGGTSARIDIVYAMHDDRAAACDVSAWSFQAFSRAPSDKRVNQRYGFARHPFRDAEGVEIPAGEDIGGSYPWIDRAGANLFFKSAARPLYFEDTSDAGAGAVARSSFPARCVSGVTCDASAATGVATEAKANLRGTSVMGLWTHGRQVMLDGRTNNIDFGLGNDDTRQREVKLYGAADRLDVGWVRVGAGRQVDADEIPAGAPREPGGNNSTINSLENLFQHLPEMQPKTPRDVVWTINTQNTSEEIVFDEWIDPHALVVSDMMPALGRDPITREVAYRDGFVEGAGYGGPGAVLRMQNAATALPSEMRVPSFGAVLGPGRAEPVALGGIFGRGLWMTGQTRLVYEIPDSQPKPFDNRWYTALFVDTRFPDDAAERRLMTFPDGSFIAFKGRSAITLYGAGGGASPLAAVALPSALSLRSGWHHVGFRRGGGVLTVFVDGFALQEVTLPQPAPFGFRPGLFTIGKLESDTTRAGVRGWFDEVRVLNEPVSPELACNHAHGTLVSLDAAAPTSLKTLAAAYPAAGHALVSNALPRASRATTYACVHDYTADYRVSLASLPAGTKSLRQTLLQPQALRASEPRPDETSNAFCATCHVDGPGRAPSLTLTAALARNPNVTMANDPRRQPMQPPALVFGNIPAGYAGGLPTVATKAPAGGLPIDAWLAP